jgi:hypothetical protein
LDGETIFIFLRSESPPGSATMGSELLRFLAISGVYFTEWKTFYFFHEKFNILVSKGVDRVEAPVVALVTDLATEGAAAGSPLAAGCRGLRGCRWSRFSLLDHLADLHVRVALAVRVVAQKVHQVLIIGLVPEEDPGGRAGRWLRRLRRGHPFLPLGRGWIGAEPWCGREVLQPAWRVGWRDRGVDRALAGGAGFPEAVLEKVPFAFQEGHLIVEHGDVPAEEVDLPVGLAGRPWLRCELVSAERALLFPKLFEAVFACHVAAFHDCGICVGEVFQADATLGRLAVEGLQDQSADVRVNHCVPMPLGIVFPILNNF